MSSSDSDDAAHAASGSGASAAANGSSPAGGRANGRRTSGRVRKEIQRLGGGTNGRKVTGSDDDDDDEEENVSESDAGDDGEFKVPTSLKTGSRKRAPPTAKADGPNKRKKNGTAATAAAGRRGAAGRKKKAAAGDGDEDVGPRAKTGAGASAVKIGKDFKISDDNEIFNAVKSPNSALQQVAEDWIESYKAESGPAMAELVNFVFRCCGCNASVDEHQAEDENGIVENLKDIVDEFKQEANLAYPLISKSKGYKKFRTSLSSFLQKLLHSSADDLLYATPFYEHLQAWIHALSSSQIRALRHTATVLTLQLVHALSLLRIQVDKEHAQVVRAKEAEEKKGRKDKARLRDMERQVKEAHERLQAVEELIEESYTSVFVNRYRDADAVIRAECISALGGWMKSDPDHWIDGDYLRYIGWVLSDESKEARRESVRALFALYQKEAYLGKLHHFTDRFKQQIVDMAVGEHDLNVRIQALHVVRQIDAHGLLDDEKQRDEVATLVFEKEKRVRLAAAEFFRGLVDEQVEEVKSELEAHGTMARGRKVGNKKSDKERERALQQAVGYKVLAELLVKYGRTLDGRASADDGAAHDSADEAGDDETDASLAEVSMTLRTGEDDAEGVVPRGRVGYAVEALWDAIEGLQDWEAMLGYLLKDHSSGGGGAAAKGPKTKGKGKGKANGCGKKAAQEQGGDADMEDAEAADDAEDEELPEQVRLTESEETLLVEVLLATLTRTTQASAVTKKDQEQEDEELATVSRVVIYALPKLFAKHQAFPARMADILAIPRLISLDLYLDMQKISAYEALWDDVTKQLKKGTDSDVLDQAARTLVVFLATTNLSATNQAKVADLERELVVALRTAAGEDVENASFEEDDLAALTASVARIEHLYRVKSLNEALDERDGTAVTSAVELVDGIVARGRRGYKEEEPLVSHAIRVLAAHLSWHLLSAVSDVRQAGSSDLPALVAVSEERRILLEKLEEFAVGNDTNAAEGVKRVALTALLDIHVVAHTLTSPASDPNRLLEELKLEANEELQARCAGYIEAEIERHAETLAEEAENADSDDAESDAEEDEEGSETETESTQRSKRGKGRKAKGKKVMATDKRKRKTAAQIRADNAKERARLLATSRFEQTLAPFVRAIHSGAFELRHAAVLLKYWGQLGPVFDEQAKLLMHDLRDEGNYGSTSDIVASVVVDAIRGAAELYIDASEETATDEHLVSLGRHLQGVAAVRGAQLALISTLPSEDHLRLHLDALKWAVAKLARFEEAKRKGDRDRLLSFFKALGHLLLGLDGRSALKVKTSLDSLLDEHNIEVPAMSKIWEPLRAYQRRLITNMSKDPSIQKAAEHTGKGKGKKKDQAAPDADEDEDELAGAADDDEEEAEGAEPAARSPMKKRKAPAAGDENDDGQSAASPATKRRRASEDLEGEDAVDALLAGIGEGSPDGAAGEQEEGGIAADEAENDADEGAESRAEFEREESVESVMSLTDIKQARRRKHAQ